MTRRARTEVVEKMDCVSSFSESRGLWMIDLNPSGRATIDRSEVEN